MGSKPYYYYGFCIECGGAFKTTNRRYRVCSTVCGCATRDRRRHERELADGAIRSDENGCWVWTRRLSPSGYGPYRRFYVRYKGPIPKGLHIDHLCRNRACCNPDHMEPVTKKENTLRGMGGPAQNARKTHCDYGHEFTRKNTYVDPHGWRYCRECKRIYFRQYRRDNAEVLRARDRERYPRRKKKAA